MKNAQIVAAASEELAAAIHEVAAQVDHASTVARGAAAKGADAQATIGSLSEAAERIGAVVRLIADIAGKTNLPPLMLIISRYIRCLRRYLADLTRGIPMILQS
jgi:methyl-accepting chemotaxis protein